MEKFSWSFFIIFLTYFLSYASAKLQISNTVFDKEEGNDLMIVCSDEEGREIIWEGPDGKIYNSKTQPYVTTGDSSATYLTFHNLSKRNAGKYTCIAGNDRQTCQLNVFTNVRFVDTPDTYRAKEGEDIVLKCEINSNDAEEGRTQYIWSPIINSTRFSQIADGLSIKHVSRNDSRIYKCMASVPNSGKLLDTNINLIVQYPPSPVNPQEWKNTEILYGFVGGKAELFCGIIGVPHPTYVWKLNGRTISHEKSMVPNLSIQLVGENSFAKYTCEAKNSLGKLEKHFHLRQTLQPSPPADLKITGENSDIVVLSVIYNETINDETNSEDTEERLEVIGHRFKYRKFPEKIESDVTVDIPWTSQYFDVTEDNTYRLEKLDADTAYEVEVASVFETGESDYTDSKIFKTMKKNASSTIYLCSILMLIVIPWPMII